VGKTLLRVSGVVAITLASALGVHAESLPAGMSLTCQFTSGPRAGTSFNFTGIPNVTPAPIGGPCSDGAGSTGYAIAPGGGAAAAPPGAAAPAPGAAAPAPGAAAPAPGATPGGGRAGAGGAAAPSGAGLPAGMSLTCKFTSGPRAGTSFNFTGIPNVTPAPIGGPCSDGAGSTGYAQ
jgi:hypothetical protein